MYYIFDAQFFHYILIYFIHPLSCVSYIYNSYIMRTFLRMSNHYLRNAIHKHCMLLHIRATSVIFAQA